MDSPRFVVAPCGRRSRLSWVVVLPDVAKPPVHLVVGDILAAQDSAQELLAALRPWIED
jgi:hypothetical protein